ncbi:MAG: 1-(5-phosphoribosyl)-5-[(5-phosphoribosylamino)methylideneamino] imidazole-4-carboxamide isomerase [Nanoarchaeota archaeon]|nr:1-(5-phosphoribosyl)-5-[(5-phosphoribosylamino)methylideneamino] imidazole-4-carboxamide isomerase [Nanoarchaeota archaeon]MBU1704900.1 1-(5-phosphoribosyl)-5-[(5-phosphoribosylamino)methylideneamino] imidazole-4-carboxamide isomerase [Nanoarchaeota archaeon]
MIPCIDLMAGKVVQLVQGKEKKLELELDFVMDKLANYKTIQVIDLDGAMGKGSNLEQIKLICSRFNCRVGGGIRTVEKAKEILALGAEKVIISSSVFRDGKVDYGFLTSLYNKIGKKKVMIALDTFKGKVLIKGWKESTNLIIFDIIKKLEPYCSEFLATYVDKEGMMQGTDIDFFRKLKELTSNELTAAGGITTKEEINALENINIKPALGMYIYSSMLN